MDIIFSYHQARYLLIAILALFVLDVVVRANKSTRSHTWILASITAYACFMLFHFIFITVYSGGGSPKVTANSNSMPPEWKIIYNLIDDSNSSNQKDVITEAFYKNMPPLPEQYISLFKDALWDSNQQYFNQLIMCSNFQTQGNNP